MVVAPHELLCWLCLELVASEAMMMSVFIRFLFLDIQNYSCDEFIRSCGPAWWSLMCSAESTNLVKWWLVGNHLMYCDEEVVTAVVALLLLEDLPARWMCNWLRELVAATSCCCSSSFHVCKKFIVPSSHSKSELDRCLVWSEWLVACWL